MGTTPTAAGQNHDDILTSVLARLAAAAEKPLTARPHYGDTCETLEEHRRLHVRPALFDQDIDAESDDEPAQWPFDAISDPVAKAVATAFAEQLAEPGKPGKRTLILTGPTGAHKTSTAISLGRHIIATPELSRHVRYIKHSTYLERLRPDVGAGESNAKIRAQFKRCPVLILDDLAAGLDVGKPVTDFVRAETTGLIGDRANAGRLTVVTTNLTTAMFKALFDDRLTSRLGMDAVLVTLTGRDSREPVEWSATHR